MSSYRDHLRSMGGMLGEQAANEIEELEKACALLFKENAALKEKLAALSAQPAPGAVPVDKLLDTWDDHCWSVKAINSPTGGDDYDVRYVVIQHHMSAPHEREIAEGATPREALLRALRAKEKV